MKTKKLFPNLWFVTSVVLIAAIMRLIPHWPNFTPIAAIALFGGVMFGKKYIAFIIPLLALFVSDLIIGFHSSMYAVYLSFAITVLIGMRLRRKLKVFNLIAASLISSSLFFIITNFAAWIGSPFYANNFAGLMQSYAAGLAFFNDGSLGISMFLNEVTGSLFFNTILFGVYYIAQLRFPILSIKTTSNF